MNARKRRSLRPLSFLILTMFWSCGSSKTTRSPTDQSALLIHRAAAQSFAIAEQSETSTFRVRQNPAKCDCPIYETFIYGHWSRIIVEPETMQTQLGTYGGEKNVSGSLSKSKIPDPRGVRYLVLTIDGIK